MALEKTFTEGGAVPEWVKEGGTVAVIYSTRGWGPSVYKAHVERVTKTLVILNDGKRFNLKAGLTEYGFKRTTWGPSAPFLADWDSAPVKSALREQFLRTTANDIAAKARKFGEEPDGKKAVELIDLLTRWAKADGMEVPK